MLNRYIFDFVLTDGNECGQILTDGSTECGKKNSLIMRESLRIRSINNEFV
jgi:hypothetical protein